MEVANLEQYFSDYEEENPREAAEVAFAIAMKAKQDGNIEKATEFGKRSVQLFEQLNVQTMEECANLHMTINGIGIPDLIHEDVVRSRLKPIEL